MRTWSIKEDTQSMLFVKYGDFENELSMIEGEKCNFDNLLKEANLETVRKVFKVECLDAYLAQECMSAAGVKDFT